MIVCNDSSLVFVPELSHTKLPRAQAHAGSSTSPGGGGGVAAGV